MHDFGIWLLCGLGANLLYWLVRAALRKLDADRDNPARMILIGICLFFGGGVALVGCALYVCVSLAPGDD